MFNIGVKEYLEYYTETAGIEKMVFESSYPVDDEGYTSIDSSKDLKIHFYVRNPKKINLIMNYTPPEGLDDTDGMKDLLNGLSDKSGSITSLDGTNTEYVMTIKKEDLKKIDINGDLSRIIDGNITVERIINPDSPPLSICAFPLEKLRINSRPEKIRGAMFQLDGSSINENEANNNSKYVVCFNVKKFDSTVHAKDTFDIYINGTFGGIKKTIKWQFDEDHSTLTKDTATDNDDNIKLVIGYDNYLVANSNKKLLNLSGTTDEDSQYGTFYNTYVTGNTEYLNLFLLTDKHYQKNEECRYTITIKDNKGLSVSTTVLNTGYQLEKPSVKVSNGTNTKTNTEISGIKISATPEIETLKVTFNHDGSNFYYGEDGARINGIKTPSNPYVNYVIKYGNEVYASGTERAPYSIDIPPSKNNQKYSFECYASCDGFVDSENMDPVGNLQVIRSSVYYVSQNGKSPDEGALGTKASPFRTIQQAVDEITTQATDFGEVTDGYTINLLSNITPDADTDFKTPENYAMVNITKPYKYTINGNGHTIDAKRDDKNRGQVICIGDEYTDITINDAKIIGSNFTGSGGAIFCKGSLTLNNVEITNNFAAYGAGINIRSGSCNFISGSVHDNTATQNAGGILIDPNSSLTLGDASDTSSIVKIYNNKAQTMCGGVSVDGTFTINRAQIYDNTITKNGNEISNNVYLPTGKTIIVGGNLSGSKIGVTTETVPTVSKPVVITGVMEGDNLKGTYGAYNSDEPYKYFKSDAGYQVGKKAVEEHNNNEEVILTPLGGGVSNYDQPKLNVKLDSNYFYSGMGRDITVTVFDPSQSGTGADGKDVTSDCKDFNLSLSVAGYDYEGIKSNSRKIYIPSSLSPDNYELHVKFTYNNYPYDITVPLYGRLSIEGLQTAPTTGTYPCATKEGLNKLSEWVASGSSLAGVTIELSNDIELDNSFVPIGYVSDNDVKPFKGVFDGKNHTISNLNITECDIDSPAYALFMKLSGEAELKNLTAEGSSTCAGLVGEVESGANVEITNCVNNIRVNMTTSLGGNCQTGGIVGTNNGTLVIDSCINVAKLASKKCLGGIIGYNTNLLTVRNCISSGELHKDETGGNQDNRKYLGGILGNANGQSSVIENCYVSAEIYYTPNNGTRGADSGGIVGNMGNIYLTLKNNFSNTSICGQGLVMARMNSVKGIYDFNYYTANNSANVEESTSRPKDDNPGNAQYKAEKNISNNYILDGSDPVKIGSFPKTNDVIDLLNYWVDSQSNRSQYKHWVNNNGTVTLED